MGNRFSRSDLILYMILSAIFVLIMLAMYMVDRQWQMMSRMQTTLSEQANDLASLRDDLRLLNGKLAVGIELARGEQSKENAQTDVATDTFSRARKATEQSDYASGDWLIRAFGNGLKTITPLVSADVYASQVQGLVLESLLSRDPVTLTWAGHIAERWRVSEDGLIITFSLRKNVRFSDGEPLTANDVAFTFSFIQNEKIAAPRMRAVLDKIESVKALDEFTVEFKYREPYFNGLALAGGLNILPEHFYSNYLQAPESFNQSKGVLLGSGPYRLDDPSGWTPDVGFVELAINPRYWGSVQPTYKRVIWKIIENENARLTTFRNGDLDVYGEEYGARVRPREYQTLLKDKKLTSRTNNFAYMGSAASYSYIGWNQNRAGKKTLFSDLRIRQAMTYLTDRERIIDEIQLGHAEPAMSPFNPRSPQHNRGLNPRPFSVEKASALLKEAGFEDRNGDGVLEDEQGRLFEFELVYFQGNTDTNRMVLFLKDLYARAGILLKPVAAEWSVMIDLLDRRDFDAITLGWTSGIETDIYQMFHSGQIENGGDNFVSYDSEALDSLIERARSTVDEEARMKLWKQAEQIIYQEQPYTFLMRKETLSFIDKRIRNLTVTDLGLNLDFVPIETYVPRSLQKYSN